MGTTTGLLLDYYHCYYYHYHCYYYYYYYYYYYFSSTTSSTIKYPQCTANVSEQPMYPTFYSCIPQCNAAVFCDSRRRKIAQAQRRESEERETSANDAAIS